MVNNFNTHIGIMVYNVVLSAIMRIIMLFDIDIGVVVNNLDTQIGVVVNDFDFAIKRKDLPVRPCNRASVFVNRQIVPTFNGLGSGGLTY